MKKYDKESMRQLQDIERSRQVEELKKQLQDLSKFVYEIEQRIEVLEVARQVQIGLNAKFAKKPKVKKKKFTWSLWQ